ncbi:hypothetical protein DPEC_G00111330 [Dallia pectoralis]|uniref:Uncharacterized protein n=1 Tax=Dallia pectoralis TaxID=75939 RepID=A0ACC2GTT4_DALPE|nr:hypothetical protein DPEC_G00111330 [Dallia pectoralis]
MQVDRLESKLPGISWPTFRQTLPAPAHNPKTHISPTFSPPPKPNRSITGPESSGAEEKHRGNPTSCLMTVRLNAFHMQWHSRHRKKTLVLFEETPLVYSPDGRLRAIFSKAFNRHLYASDCVLQKQPDIILNESTSAGFEKRLQDYNMRCGWSERSFFLSHRYDVIKISPSDELL